MTTSNSAETIDWEFILGPEDYEITEIQLAYDRTKDLRAAHAIAEAILYAADVVARLEDPDSGMSVQQRNDLEHALSIYQDAEQQVKVHDAGHMRFETATGLAKQVQQYEKQLVIEDIIGL